MKNAFTFLTIILLSTSVRAEYNGYHIKFSIETTNGEINNGYAYVASAYLNIDSLKNTEYLKKALDQSGKEWDDRDSLVYFNERIKYEYKMVGDSLGEKIPIYALKSRQAILSSEIMPISIEEMIDYTYLIGISSPLSISDTVWIKKEPLSSYSFGGYLCYHQIYIHQNSKKIDRIINLLKAKQAEINNIEIDYHNGDEIDKEFWEMIKQLYGEKVVIITECTC